MNLEPLASKIAKAPPGWQVRKALVTDHAISVTPGVPSLLTVLLDGDGDPQKGVGYIDSYAPTNGDWVLVLVSAGAWWVLGRVAGP